MTPHDLLGDGAHVAAAVSTLILLPLDSHLAALLSFLNVLILAAVRLYEAYVRVRDRRRLEKLERELEKLRGG